MAEKNIDVSEEHENGGQSGSNANHAEHSDLRNDGRKLFVRGLNWKTKEKELLEHFGKFGKIDSIIIKIDLQTGRSRGFGFIIFADAAAIDKVIAVDEHIINNKKVDAQKAKERSGKIFVGGLTAEISDDEIRTYFEQFGSILEISMPFNKQKNQRKGFCFITFESEQVVNELLKTPKQKISGKQIDVKHAAPKPQYQIMAMRRRRGYAHQYSSQTGYPAYGAYDIGYDAGYGDYFNGGYDYDYSAGGDAYEAGK